jgi:hypothetical protein
MCSIAAGLSRLFRQEYPNKGSAAFIRSKRTARAATVQEAGPFFSFQGRRRTAVEFTADAR